MGQSLNPLTTHEPVSEDVKKDVPPIDYTPCPDEERQIDCEVCEDCGSSFGWLCASTNCDVCGRMLCTRCCPARYLLHDHPGCAACTQNAYRQRRSEMLQEHYAASGVKRPTSRPALRGQTIRVNTIKQTPVEGVPASDSPLAPPSPQQTKQEH